MAELYDTVLQAIKDRCPKGNWKLGGLLRELLIEPINVMQRTVTSYINTATASLDLDVALSKPAQNEQVLDVWMRRLRLTAPATKAASGKVKILLSSADSGLTVPSRATFRSEGVELMVDRAYKFTASRFSKIAEECYACEVVVTVSSGDSVNLLEGTPVTWDAAPVTVLDMYVSSAVTGGVAELSAQEKANKIQSALDAEPLFGEAAISAALRQQFPGLVVSAVKGNTARRPNRMPLYVKSKALPVGLSINVPVTVDSNTGARHAPIDATGVVEITSVTTADSRPLRFSTEWIDDECVVSILDEVDQGAEVTINYTGFPDTSTVVSWMNAAQRALPYSFECLTPAVALLTMYIKVGGSDIDLSTRIKIQEYICDKPLNAKIADDEIFAILAEAGYTATGAILYSSRVKYHGYTDVWSSSGSVAPAGQLGLSGAPVALYCTVTDIIGC